MTAQTGRTVSHYLDFVVGDENGVLRSIPIDSINGVGLEHEEVDLTAFMDAIKGSLLNLPSCKIAVTGPWDTGEAEEVGTYSGSHTVLSAIVGLNVPLTLDVRCGMRHTWESGEPQFGISHDDVSGFLCSKYVYDGAGKYSAEFIVAAGSIAPEWGTTAET